jgi:phosphate transport system permease protein
MRRHRSVGDRVLAASATGAVVIVSLLLVALLGSIVVLGAPMLTPSFLFGRPSADLTGGIWPAAMGTAACTLLMTLAGVPVSVITAIWLTHYARPSSPLSRVIRAAVRNLAGVPSIVFGLFGLGFFVLFVGRSLDRLAYGPTHAPVFGRPAILWSSLTLAILTMPVIVVTTEEALRRVPKKLEEGALALGASRVSMILTVALPHARAGILTGIILAIGRGAGEVAPILFTGVASYLPRAPTDARDGFMHLGYHVYVLATQSPDVDLARPALFGTVLVLLIVTTLLDAAAIALRHRSRRES